MGSRTFNQSFPLTSPSADLMVGSKLRKIRAKNYLSLRALADRSGLNVNTLSLIENGKSSPSVSTLQQLALALDVPIAAFFESETTEKQIVYTKESERSEQTFGSTRMQNLGREFVGNSVQPFIVTIMPGMGSGGQTIVHTGFEFVYCISGKIKYQIDNQEFNLEPGDSLLFQAHLPHIWQNTSEIPGQIMLVLFPSDETEKSGHQHFTLISLKKEINMKIATITDDGKTISQHFGRAPYYLVLTIEEGKIVNREMRDKMGHNHFTSQEHVEEPHSAGHGTDSDSHNKHVSMAEAISDCEALLCGGMGMGAYESMRKLNIKPVVTDTQDIELAVQAYIDGKLIDHTELLH